MRRLLGRCRRAVKRWSTPAPAPVLDPLLRLRQRGLIMGNDVNVLNGVMIDPDHCWHISIGNRVTLAPHVHILAHDASTKMFLGYTRIGKVKIGDEVFIGARSIIMPGVSIGSRVIVGAGSVVTKDIPSGSVAAGNPARVITDIETFLAKRKTEIDSVPVFGEEYTLRQDVNAVMRDEMNDRMVDRIGYVD